MNDSVVISKNQLDTINSRITELEQIMHRVIEKIEYTSRYVEPLEGTDEWWIWSDKQARADIKAGRTTPLKSKKDIDQFFKTL